MELILKETIDTLGEEGKIVKVKPGYGRNFLLPKGKAVVATKGNLAILEQNKATIEARRKQQKAEAEALGKKIAGASVVIAQRVGEDGRLYGSVTNGDIAAKLAELGIEIDKKKILLDQPIKTIGVTSAKVKVGYQMSVDLNIEIVDEAAAAVAVEAAE
ncbi:MAG: 50S ribosomal protein L9 [Desulfobulbaceae bacterium]|nr:50S ribosomal protein L9 [Desulfobulbaceae bacterium]